MNIFEVIPPAGAPVPIVLSVPHCGTWFPPDLRSEFVAEKSETPDDTDWFVHKLYDFAPAMGITMIYAKVSRWVIDLNRDPESKPLYNDGRVITALCPTTDFLGTPIYKDQRGEVLSQEVHRRLQLYYWPYHRALQQRLDQLHERFGEVLLWDCHSIRQHVPSIRHEKFPDLILGDADGTAAAGRITETTLAVLRKGSYSISHNHPFKGGYITRSFGKPHHHRHALQLEMTKVNYMDNAELSYDDGRADRMRSLLKSVFEELIKSIGE